MRNLGTTLTSHPYMAYFGRYGKTSDNSAVAILMNVMDAEGNVLSDHVWVKDKIFKQSSFKKGELISFSAEPYRYIKGVYRRKVVKKLQSDIGLRNIIFFGRQCQKN